jgi:hypothetical protein
MIYDPQVYAIKDQAMVKPFISEKEIEEILA